MEGLTNSCITGVIGSLDKFIDKFNDKRELSIIKQRKIDYNYTVSEYIKYILFNNYISVKDYNKKIDDSLKIVGLNKSYLTKKVSTLSSSELKLIILAGNLIGNPNTIIFDNYFSGLDNKNTKKVINILNKLIDKYNKKIYIISSDTEFLYQYTKNLIIYKNDKLLIEGKTNYIFEKENKKLINNNIRIPNTVIFTDLVRKKKRKKLNYNKDIRDLIKDIYKKV